VKVVLVNSEYPDPKKTQGGIAAYTARMAQALHRQAIDVCVCGMFCPRDLVNSPVPFYPLSFVPPFRLSNLWRRVLPGAVFWHLGICRSLSTRIEMLASEHSPLIVDVPDFNGLGLFIHKSSAVIHICNFRTPLALVDKINNKKFSFTSQLMHVLEYAAIKRARWYRSGSNDLARRVKESYRLKAAQIAIIRNPITPLNKRAPVRAKQNTTFMFHGRLEQRKGIQTLIAMLPAFFIHRPKLFLHIVADYSSPQALHWHSCIEQQARQCNAEDQITFFPFTDMQTLARRISRCQAVLVPSLWDNSPNTILEAMSCATLVIAANNSGAAELINHKQTGLLFKTADHDELLKQIVFSISNPTEIRKIQRAAHAYCLTTHHESVISTQTISFYESCIHRSKTQRIQFSPKKFLFTKGLPQTRTPSSRSAHRQKLRYPGKGKT